MTEAEYYLSAYGPQKSWDEEGYNYFEDDPGFPCLADTDRNLHLIRGSEGPLIILVLHPPSFIVHIYTNQ